MPRMALALLAFVAATGAIFLFLFGKTGSKVRLEAPYTVSVDVPTAVTLSPTSNVRAAGVTIGSVKEVRPLPGGTARITFEVDDAHAPLPRESRFLVRTKTLLGENYLSVEPGSKAGGTMPDGGRFALRQSDDAVQLDDVLSVLDRPTRRRLQRTLRGSARLVDGRGEDLNRALGALAPTVRDGGVVARTLATQRDDVHAVVDRTGTLLAAIADRDRQLGELVRAGKGAADALAARDGQIAETVRALPGLLRQTEATTAQLGGFARRSAGRVDAVTRAAVALRPTVRDLEPAAGQARRLFDRVPRLVEAADPLLARLRDVSSATAPLMDELGPLLATLNPALQHLGRYSREFGSFFANVGAPNNEYDALGAIIRVHPLVGPENLGLLDAKSRELFDRVLDVTGVGRIRKLQRNPFPEPGTIGTPRPWDGKVPRIPSSG